MKKLIVLLVFFVDFTRAQTPGNVPNFINYQAILRDASGNELPSGNNVQVNFKIYNTAIATTPVFEENHSVTIPATKVVNLKIGKGVVAAGSFSAITWESGDIHYLVSLDGTQVGTKMPFATVPYAFYSGRTSASGLPPGTRHAQTIYYDSLQSKWIPTLNLNNNGDRVSVGGYSNRNKFSVFSVNTLDSAAILAWKISANGRDAAFRGYASGTTTNFTANPSQSIIYGAEFYGVNSGSGYGVGLSGVGISDNGNGYGVAAVGSTKSSTATAVGVYASTTGTNSNSRYAGYFDNGMVYIKDSVFLGFPNNPGTPNDVLSMSSTGKLRWRTLNSSSPISLTSIGTITVSPLTPSTAFTLTSLAPQFVNQGIGSITPGSFPNYTLNVPPPTFTSIGLGSITGSYPNFVLNVPPPSLGFNNATGTFSFVQGTYNNTLNISPNLSLLGNTLSVAGNTVNLPGLGLWAKPSATAIALGNINDYVGIGTNTPAQKLDVIGYLRVGAGNLVADEAWLLYSPSPGLSILRAGARASTEMRLDQGNNAPITFMVNGSERVRILPNGNVGIGNTNPTGKLVVNGNIVVPTASSLRFATPKTKYKKVSAFQLVSANSASYQARIDDGFSSGNINGLNSLWAQGVLPVILHILLPK